MNKIFIIIVTITALGQTINGQTTPGPPEWMKLSPSIQREMRNCFSDTNRRRPWLHLRFGENEIKLFPKGSIVKDVGEQICTRSGACHGILKEPTLRNFVRGGSKTIKPTGMLRVGKLLDRAGQALSVGYAVYDGVSEYRESGNVGKALKTTSVSFVKQAMIYKSVALLSPACGIFAPGCAIAGGYILNEWTSLTKTSTPNIPAQQPKTNTCPAPPV